MTSILTHAESMKGYVNEVLIKVFPLSKSECRIMN